MSGGLDYLIEQAQERINNQKLLMENYMKISRALSQLEEQSRREDERLETMNEQIEELKRIIIRKKFQMALASPVRPDPRPPVKRHIVESDPTSDIINGDKEFSY